MTSKSSSLFIHTPLLNSHPLSQRTGKNIYLKCENMQPSGSFKDRGIGALCLHYAQQKVKGFVCSSGGNAGMAVAYASNQLQIQATIIIPVSTPEIMIKKIKAENVDVIVKGENWDEADAIARAMSEELKLAYIPPFNNPVIWQGYHSLVQELQEEDVKPDAIILSVGGGGLYTGIIEGLHAIGWHDIAIITAETEGAASLATAMHEKKRVKLDKIETIAGTLGAKQICEKAFEWTKKYPTFPEVVTDKEAVNACLKFSDDHRLLVEPACGASLAVLYEKRSIIQKFNNIVLIVCGGSGVSLNLLEKWKEQFQIQ